MQTEGEKDKEREGGKRTNTEGTKGGAQSSQRKDKREDNAEARRSAET
jgi:hypothetical protein